MATVARRNLLSMDAGRSRSREESNNARVLSGGGGAPCLGPRGTLYTHRVAFTSNMAQDPEYIRKPIASFPGGRDCDMEESNACRYADCGPTPKYAERPGVRLSNQMDSRSVATSTRSHRQRYTPRGQPATPRRMGSAYYSGEQSEYSSANNTPRMEFGRLEKQPRRIDPISWTMPNHSEARVSPSSRSCTPRSRSGLTFTETRQYAPAGKTTGQFVPVHARTPAADEYFQRGDDSEHFRRGPSDVSASRSPSPLPVEDDYEESGNRRRYPAPSTYSGRASGIKKDLNLELADMGAPAAGGGANKNNMCDRNFSYGKSKFNLHNMHNDDLVSNCSSRVSSKLSEANLARHDFEMDESRTSQRLYSSSQKGSPRFGPISLLQLKKRSQPWEVTPDVNRTTPRTTPRGGSRMAPKERFYL